MNNQFDIWLSQGDTFNLSLTATDCSGNPINLSGCYATGGVRYNYGSTGDYLINLNPVIDPSFVSGIINISTNIPFDAIITKGVYDIQIINTGTNFTFKALHGYANIIPCI